MKKYGLIIVGVLLLLGLGNVVINLVNPPKLQPATPEPQGFKLAEMLKSGSDTKCVFENKATPAARSGTIYISGSVLRTDYDVASGNTEKAMGHLLSIGGFYYIWTNQKTGIKINTSAFGGQNATESAAKILQAYTYMDDKSEINCLPWLKDVKMFQIPEEIIFEDKTQTLLNLKYSITPTITP